MMAPVCYLSTQKTEAGRLSQGQPGEIVLFQE